MPSKNIAGAINFVIGPEKQMKAYEVYLKIRRRRQYYFISFVPERLLDDRCNANEINFCVMQIMLIQPIVFCLKLKQANDFCFV